MRINWDLSSPQTQMELVYTNLAKDSVKTVDFLYHSSNYLTPPAILFLYDSQIRLKMSTTVIFGLELHSLYLPIQKCLYSLLCDELFSTLQILSNRQNVASSSLLYCYFRGKCSDDLHSLVPSIESRPFLSYYISKNKFYSNRFSHEPLLRGNDSQEDTSRS